MTQPDGEGTPPANTGESGEGGVTATLYTKQQLDHTAGQARRGALDKFFKDLGMDNTPSAEEMQQIFTAAAEHRKQQDGQKTDVERLTGELATEKEKSAKVPGLETQLLRARIAGDAGLKSRYWKYIEGDDEDSIKASVQATLADVGGGGSADGDESGDGESSNGKPRQQGTGRLTPNPQQGSGGGQGSPKASIAAGVEAYKAKHKKE